MSPSPNGTGLDAEAGRTRKDWCSWNRRSDQLVELLEAVELFEVTADETLQTYTTRIRAKTEELRED